MQCETSVILCSGMVGPIFSHSQLGWLVGERLVLFGANLVQSNRHHAIGEKKQSGYCCYPQWTGSAGERERDREREIERNRDIVREKEVT